MMNIQWIQAVDNTGVTYYITDARSFGTSKQYWHVMTADCLLKHESIGTATLRILGFSAVRQDGKAAVATGDLVTRLNIALHSCLFN